MPIITQPPRSVVSALRPVQFEAMQTGSTTAIIQNAVVDVYFKGDLLTTFRVSPNRTAPALFPGITEYYFCIDVSEKLQDALAPFATLPEAFVLDCPPFPVQNNDTIGDFYLSITYEFLDLNDNKIKPVALPPDVTNVFYSAAICRADLAAMYLDEFTNIFPAGRLLTDSPRNLSVCKSDNVFLSVLNPDVLNPINGVRIRLFDAAGGSLGEAVVFMPTVPGEADILTLNTGIDNGLNCLFEFSTSGGYDVNNPLLSYYLVDFGFISLGTFTPAREAMRYTLDGCKCCDKKQVRLHWFNCLAGVDSYTFCSVKELRQKTTSATAKKALSWNKTSVTPHNPTEAALFKTRITEERTLRVVSRDLTNTAAEWLSGIFTSVLVYIELDGVLVPVVVNDAERIINKATGKIKLEFTAKFSACEPKHRI